MKKLRKGKYRVVNWGEYNKSLKKRGDISIWISEEAIESWIAKTGENKSRGRQIIYSDIAVQTIYTLRQVYNLRLRQAEGFAKSLLKIMKINIAIPDYSTISRRIRKLSVDIVYKKPEGRINLIIDSTGIKVVGEKEWINHKHGQRQRKIWRKLHIGITDCGNIIAGEVTSLRDSDIATSSGLLSQVSGDVSNIIADGAYYRSRMLSYMSSQENTKNAKLILPPGKPDQLYRMRLKVEETFSRYKRIIGNKFKALNFKSQQSEAKLSLLILNKMMDIGMPKTIRIA